MSKIIVDNRKARHDYFLVEKFEAGIVLVGTEVKSLRAGRANLKDSYAQIDDGELYLYNMHISPYEHGSFSNVDPTRKRKLLNAQKGNNALLGKVKEKGLTLVPTKLYFSNGRVKVEIALAQGKKLHGKRATQKEKDAKRKIDKAMKAR